MVLYYPACSPWSIPGQTQSLKQNIAVHRLASNNKGSGKRQIGFGGVNSDSVSGGVSVVVELIYNLWHFYVTVFLRSWNDNSK